MAPTAYPHDEAGTSGPRPAPSPGREIGIHPPVNTGPRPHREAVGRQTMRRGDLEQHGSLTDPRIEGPGVGVPLISASKVMPVLSLGNRGGLASFPRVGQALAVRGFDGRNVLLIGRQNMNDWQFTYLGRGALPSDLSGFEIEAVFTYSESERRVIERASIVRPQACLGATDWLFTHDRSFAGGVAYGAPGTVAPSGRAVRDRRTGHSLALHDVSSASRIV